MSTKHYKPSQALGKWSPDGPEATLEQLQKKHHLGHAEADIPKLLRDPALGNLAVVASFGVESAVLMHYVANILPGVTVIFLDTGKHFDETLAYRDTLAKLLDINIIPVQPSPEEEALEDSDGMLHRRDPDACCRLRKVVPLQNALEPFDTWFTGRKRFQGGHRSRLPILERDGPRLKINPLAHWEPTEIDNYFRKHDLPKHPLASRGFRSIGCMPCTRRVREGEPARAGRWPQAPKKLECGIHFGIDGKISRA